MHTNSKSLKKAAGTLVLAVSVVSAVFGLTACGSHGGGMRRLEGAQSVSAPLHVAK
jgi:hypothetical protein